MKHTLTPEQQNVLQCVVGGVRKDKKLEQSIGGYAGVGKSFLISYLAKFFPKFAVCAFTGKAANVLRKKGLKDASTIHSLIYTPLYDEGVLLGFDVVAKSELGCEGFIVDEASMVGSDIYYDLKSFGIPMVFVGDHGQLEPIGSDFNLMHSPNYRLEEIHRNAGDIAKFCERLRKGYSSKTFNESKKVEIKSQKSLKIDDYIDADQVICAYNKTRVDINKKIRAELGYTGVLNIGERVMCLKNNKSQGLFNGMQGVVRDLYVGDHGRSYMDFEFDGLLYSNIWYDKKQFGQEKPDTESFGGKDNPNPFEYAYCITAHKSQGDEWNRVLALEQRCAKWDHRRWAYTVGSRAREYLKWAYQ